MLRCMAILKLKGVVYFKGVIKGVINHTCCECPVPPRLRPPRLFPDDIPFAGILLVDVPPRFEVLLCDVTLFPFVCEETPENEHF